MKKVLIQSKEQLDLVKEEIRVSSLFNHPNLLPLLDHAIIAVKVNMFLHMSFALCDAICNRILNCPLYARFKKTMLKLGKKIMLKLGKLVKLDKYCKK